MHRTNQLIAIGLLSWLTLLAGCATTDQDLTQANVERANQRCQAQLKAERGLSLQWFSRWVGCRQTHVMPFEILAYPHKEAEIRAMYGELLAMGLAVDAGQTSLQSVHRRWDQLQFEIGMHRCLIRQEHADGTSRCATR